MKKYRIENRTRSKLILQAVRPAQAPRKGVVHDPDHDLEIGDAADTDEALETLGAVRGPRCPSPVLVVTEADLDRLAPSSRLALDALSKGPRPSLVVTEIAA